MKRRNSLALFLVILLVCKLWRKEKRWNEKRMLYSPNATGKKQIKLLSWKQMLTFKEKGHDSKDRVFGPEHRTPGHYFQVLKPNGFAWLNFPNCFGKQTPSFHCRLFGTGMSIMIILCLFHHCILEANNVFSSFTGLQMERVWPQNAPFWEPHPYRFIWWGLGLGANNL